MSTRTERRSSSSEVDLNQIDDLFESPKEDEEKDWVKVAAFVAVVVGGLLALLALLSLFKLFPTDLFGRPPIANAVVLTLAAALILPSIYAIYKRWHNPPRLI